MSVSTIVRTIFSNIMAKDALAKELVMSAMSVNPGTRNSRNGISAADRPSPSNAKFKMARNNSAVMTGARNVCAAILKKRRTSRVYKDHSPSQLQSPDMGFVSGRCGADLMVSGLQLITGLEHDETGGPGHQVCPHHNRKSNDQGPIRLPDEPIAKAVDKIEKGVEVANRL